MSPMIKNFYRKHRYTIILAGIFLLALIARVIRYYECDQLERDTFSYLNMATHWANGGILEAYRSDIKGYLSCPPLLPGAMAFGEMCGLGALTAGLWLNFLSGSAISLALYWICVGIFKNRRYAIYAALLGAVHPFTLRWSAMIMRDTPYTAAVIFAVACGVWAVKTRQMRYWALFSLCAVLASFSRKEGPELIFVFACWCVFALWRGRAQWRSELAHTVKAAVCVGSIFIACTLPLQFYLRSNSDCQWDIFNLELLSIQYQKIMAPDLEKEYGSYR